MSAERERRGRRATSPLARSLLAGAVTIGLALGSGAMTAASDAAWAATADDADAVSVDLVAAPAATGIVRPDDAASVRVTITNTGGSATGSLILSLSLDGSTVADSARLADWFSGATVDSTESVVATAAVSSLEPGASAVLDLVVTASDGTISGAFGPRLATVRASMEGAPAADAHLALDRTAVVWVPDGTVAPEASTLFVAAIATPGEAGAFLSADDLARYTAPAGGLTRTLDAVAGRPVVLAIDPRVVASIRLLGAEAPATAIAFLDRLLAAPNESFMLPWADADPLATVAATGSPLPSPEGVGIVTSAGDDVDASPSPSPQPGDAATIAELAPWPATIDGVTWAGAGGLVTPAVPVLIEQGTTVLLAPSSSLQQSASVQRLDGLSVLRADDALSAAAREASLATSEQRFDRAMARISALLAAGASAEPGIPALIALSRDRLASTDRLIDTIAQTVSLPWTTSGSAADALSRPAVDGAIVEDAVDESRLVAVRSALEAEAADRAFATIAVSPEAITDPRRLELLAALSLGWGSRSADALQAYVRDSTTLRSSVQVVESSAITLLADRASLPVTVQNQLDVAVRVFVRVDPDTTQLRVLDGRVETLVEPLSQTRALVPVESLTNGRVDITVSVRDADAGVIGTPTRVSLNLQAGWETAGTIAISIALVLLLAVGIIRDIRKRRRRRAEQS